MGCHRSVGTVGPPGGSDQPSFRALAAAWTPGAGAYRRRAFLVLAQIAGGDVVGGGHDGLGDRVGRIAQATGDVLPGLPGEDGVGS